MIDGFGTDGATSATFAGLALASRRLAVITADPRDARRLNIRATPKGRRLLQKGRQLRIASLAAQLDVLTPDELHKLSKAVEILERLLDHWV